MTHLLDTDTCIAALRGVPAAVEYLQRRSPEDCGISSVTAFELHAGVSKARSPATECAKLDRFLAFVGVSPFDDAAARAAGRIRAELHDAGTPIGPYDVLIAGHAVALGVTLVTGNVRAFRRVRGLQLESWA